MHLINQYNYYIFDCDGVILDSNKLKIEAMRESLISLNVNLDVVQECCIYFTENFGKSRFHHTDVFMEKFLNIPLESRSVFKSSLLDIFSIKCKELYLKSPITPGFIEFITELKGKKYIASGSEQNELREVFEVRNLQGYFTEIYGSPAPKAELVKMIIGSMKNKNTVIIGDAISDLEAAIENKIDFIGYLPYSNVAEKLKEKAQSLGFITVESWKKFKEL